MTAATQLRCYLAVIDRHGRANMRNRPELQERSCTISSDAFWPGLSSRMREICTVNWSAARN